MSILGVGKSGLLAAQVGLATTGHNIANANVEGYHRQVVIQGNSLPEASGGYFVGTGTEVVTIQRQYDDFLSKQLLGAEARAAEQNGYYSQISQVDNLLADSTSGLSPALQDFFKGVQDAASNPATDASRSAMLSTANTLSARFQTMSDRLSEIGEGVNAQIKTTVAEVNSFAAQIGKLNNDIAGLSSDTSAMPNDLMDQRDHLITELNKLVKVTVADGANSTLTVSIGSGQPLVIGNRNFELATGTSLTDVSRITIGYKAGDKVSELPESALQGGGALGGLLSFRSGALDEAQNKLGQVAAGLAASFNAQHALGQDRNGAMGGQFFEDVKAYVGMDARNSSLSTATITGVVKDATALTTSNYDLNYDGANFVLTRQSDGQSTVINPFPQTEPQMIDGVEYSITGTPQTGDHFEIRPTFAAASGFNVALSDVSKIALAAPISTNTPLSNTGNGKISVGSVDDAYLDPANTLNGTVTLTYDKDTGTLSGFPAAQDVVVTGVDGTSTTYPAGTATIPYAEGDKFNFGGINVAITGTPGDNDTFSITGPNAGGTKDNRNGALLADLQSKNILNGGQTTFQSSYASMVNFVGNKAREAQIGGLAADAAATQAKNAHESVVGVNLDEEAANLLRYQQAYQAAGKMMQIASQLFDVLVSLGR
ncbi:flagellar hook-associated protein FlgK [Pseudoduganella namucuonensis]|uniref:Flagellar hook-associated protein 1 n=1 Tax=Pseudoduganella namucuonensis TaxID=1035707 RepID=A0A1I7L025_9BURK|nr:flagellar hook-associated protein FlgK [Pseudoduganella namucuonensis]SFV03015.1 flagellar hook-associated protein 1 FlgK [Pseudoduganella namucuonensis]